MKTRGVEHAWRSVRVLILPLISPRLHRAVNAPPALAPFLVAPWRPRLHGTSRCTPRGGARQGGLRAAPPAVFCFGRWCRLRRSIRDTWTGRLARIRPGCQAVRLSRRVSGVRVPPGEAARLVDAESAQGGSRSRKGAQAFGFCVGPSAARLSTEWEYVGEIVGALGLWASRSAAQDRQSFTC